jgi:hypothetical protein
MIHADIQTNSSLGKGTNVILYIKDERNDSAEIPHLTEKEIAFVKLACSEMT